jgi:hypothetical protein
MKIPLLFLKEKDTILTEIVRRLIIIMAADADVIITC